MADALATKGVCCGHVFGQHLDGSGARRACRASACPCPAYISPNAGVATCNGWSPGASRCCELAHSHVSVGVDHKAGDHFWANEVAIYPVLVEGVGRVAAEEYLALAMDRQVGGDHYVKHKIGPWDIWQEYGLNAFEGAIVKYVLRHRDKGGVEDLKKARHTLDRLIEIEEARSDAEAG